MNQKASKRVSVALRPTSVLTARRSHLGRRRMVFILVGNRTVAYPNGASRIQFIGTTPDGITGLASAIAGQADAILRQRAVTSFSAHLVTCSSGGTTKAWLALRRDLLLTFQGRFGAVPVCNRPLGATKAALHFRRTTLTAILRRLS